MATYQYSQHFGYPQQQQSEDSYSSSSSDQQQQYQQTQGQGQTQNQQQQYQQQSYQAGQGGSNYYSSGLGNDGYYGFTDPAALQQQAHAYYSQSNGLGNGHENGDGVNITTNGNGNGHGHGMNGFNAPQPQFMPASYDPFELGVPTGAGMYFNPTFQFPQQQQSYYQNQNQYHHQPQHQSQTAATTNYLHRPTLQSNISPNVSVPGSAQSSHVNLTAITPERQNTRTPEDDHNGRSSPLPTALSGPTRSMKQKEGPVKAACLSCRQKKAKCDGTKPICTQCSKKGLECVYVKSKRGGARKKRETIAPSALQEFLKKLDGLLSVHDPSLSPGTTDESDDTTNVVRQFASRNEIFRCYYNEVHPFLPVMPPRSYLEEILETLLPESPFLLAAETILALVPHPLDPNPKSSNSKRLRTAASAALGKKTMDAVEAVLSSKERSLEVPQALAMLSMWEWGNAGNLSLNRARANQSLQVLMEMGVNIMDKSDHPNGRALEGEDWRKDMARRTWWAAYAGQMTAAIISGNEPVLGPDDNRVHIAYPVCSLTDTAWPNWINAMRQCVRVFSIVNAVYASVQAEGGQAWGGSPTEVPSSAADPERLKMRMLEVDAEVMALMQAAEKSAVIELVPGGEEEVVRNQQLSARLALAVTHIHIHRQQAFPEVSLFSKRICGLPQAPDFSAMMAENTGSLPPAGSVDMAQTLSNGIAMLSTEGSGQADENEDYDVIDEMWEPDTFPQDLPAPWFTNRGGATSLYMPTNEEPNHIPITATIAPINTPSEGQRVSEDRRPSVVSSQQTSGTLKPHKAWGVDKDDKTSPAPEGLGISKAMQIFPPGISLARCATAAHTIVRLEVLHRSAVIAMWDGPPKWLPFCSCGLVTGAYAFLLLALAVQADNDFATSEELVERSEEVEALLTNVKVILAGLEAYGVMWAGIEVMAGEVRAALEAASRLPYEIRGQIETLSNTASPPPSQGGSRLGQGGGRP